MVFSRSHGRENIRLLRDFDDDLFMTSPDPALVDEDARLEVSNARTKVWYERMVEFGAFEAV